VVCRLEFGTVSLLLTGDLEREGEEELLAARMPLESTVLRVGHHGSKTATSERFLDAVRPSVAVISAEYPALRRLPNTGVLQRLRSRSIEVLWTGRDGAVTIETDGKKITRISTGKIAKKRQIAGRELAVPWDGPTPW